MITVRFCLLRTSVLDIIVPELLMTGKAQVHLADNKENIELLDIELPFYFLTPDASAKNVFISYLQQEIQEIESQITV